MAKAKKTAPKAVDQTTAEEAVRVLLRWAGEDPGREGLRDTPRRVVSAYRDWYSGYGIDPREYLLLTAVAGAHLFKRNFEEVLIWTERALERKQNAIVALRYRIIALAYLGKVEEATTTMQRMLVFQPNFGLGRLKMFTFRYPWMIGLIHDGLRLAGAPE